MNQQTALNILKTGANVFLTGSAGAGKTHTLNQYIDYLRARKLSVAVTASTGIAATHMDGMTIHSWSGIGIRDELSPQQIKRLNDEEKARERFEQTDVLIIDEISMLHGRQLNMVNQVLKIARQSDAPFGGIQLVVCGDFFQLPPVSRNGELSRDKFAFMSQAWVEAQFQICYLTEQHRQGDSELTQILNAIRAQQVTAEHIDLLNRTLFRPLEDDCPTRLYTHNIDVDTINQRQLEQLEGKLYQFAATTEGNAKLIDSLKNSVRAPADLQLKMGAKVMFVKNNFEKGYVNGSQGEVIGFIDDKEKGMLPKVRLLSGEDIICEPESWSITNEDDEVLASLSQIPLRLAWAMTIHKSQGMTLQCAEIDLGRTFERGQGYVALSRLRHLDGLKLLGFQLSALELDSLAFKADQRFQQLSALAEQNIAGVELQPVHDAFIQQHGGTLDPKEIAQYKRGQHKKKQLLNPKAPSTLQETREWYDLGLSLEEIAEKREMALSTIIGHIEKLAREQQLDIERLRPDQSLLDDIRKIAKKIRKRGHEEDFYGDEQLKLTPIVRETGLDYAEVRLAMLFVD